MGASSELHPHYGPQLRPQVWKILLGVKDCGDPDYNHYVGKGSTQDFDIRYTVLKSVPLRLLLMQLNDCTGLCRLGLKQGGMLTSLMLCMKNLWSAW